MNTIWQDLRYGVRMLAKNPGFTMLGVITLALGIGANTAIFSVVNAVLLRSLPYANPDELVRVYGIKGIDAPESRFPFSPALYLHLKAHTNSLNDVAALSNKGWAANLTNSGEPERLQGFQISANLFSLLGVNAQFGRTFSTEEDQPGSEHVVVISHDLWQRRFGGDRSVLSHSLTLNNEPYTVIGVLPSDFRFYTNTDVWTPLAFDVKEANEQNSRYLDVFARRKPGFSIEQAAADTDQVTAAFINNPKSEIRVQLSAPQDLLTREVKPMLWLLLSAVGFVLLIACVNMANLSLARGTVRRRELAVRTALGASRWRVIRQLLIESLLLAVAGGAVGLLAAKWAIQFLSGGLPEYLAETNSRVALLQVDSSAFGFTVAISLITTLLFGLAPALQLSKVDLSR